MTGSGGRGDISVDPAAVLELLGEFDRLPGLMTVSRVVDEQTGKRNRRFDAEGRKFRGASGLTSALELAGRCNPGLADAGKVAEAFSRGLERVIESARAELGQIGGADTSSADVIDRTQRPW
ncbi:hypothetical protein [Longispora albida]|uniref:hypothetical protein n=1 Tax=Longispora albida TaxID=203523 RepID=UPI00035D50F4|nr:hypothetical protein [Longispora albida]